MGMDSVINHFLSRGLECSVTKFLNNESELYNEHKERTLETECVGKTLAFKVRNDSILIVVSEDLKISSNKYENYFKVKPKILTNNETIDITGHPLEGLSPLGLKKPLKVYIDVSLKKISYIYICAGLKNFVVKVAPRELMDLTDGQWLDICQHENSYAYH
ncbi:YbaK/EbsC family protein [Clostridium sp. DJ247]|uniref:YbaK/EbsC family protein n=1 Tax=Clostridium sp. DJ247 TaxID=2726188 RepID=UPI00162A4E14|nr:YbaK/EbsC family protein [Clostridium sp. DJ247]MBC2581215.1 hypothetical protein [Clostridium sp. DJ247]